MLTRIANYEKKKNLNSKILKKQNFALTCELSIFKVVYCFINQHI